MTESLPPFPVLALRTAIAANHPGPCRIDQHALAAPAAGLVHGRAHALGHGHASIADRDRLILVDRKQMYVVITVACLAEDLNGNALADHVGGRVIAEELSANGAVTGRRLPINVAHALQIIYRIGSVQSIIRNVHSRRGPALGKRRVGGYALGQSGNPNGRPRSASTAQLYMLRYFREAADLLVQLMRTGTKEDAVRLAAIREVLDRGVGKAVQSVALDLSVTKPLETMSEQELRQFRTRYAAIVSASPKLLDEVIDDEECAPELPLGDGAGGDAGNDANSVGGDDAGNSGNGSASNDENDCGPLRPGMRFRFNAAGKLEEDSDA